MWEIQILHLREQILPGIADNDGAYKLIKLEDYEYPAESTTIAYDEKDCILYVQRNKYGTSIRALTTLLQEISPNKTYVDLKPIIKHRFQYEKAIKAAKYRKFIISVDCDDAVIDNRNKSLGKIISSFSAYQGRFVKVEIGFGHSKDRFLKKDDTIELLKEVYNCPGTRKLQVDIKESDDTKVETIDLLDDRNKLFIKINYTRDNPITHERIYKQFIEQIL